LHISLLAFINLYCYALPICYASFQQYQSTIYINPSIHKSTTGCQQCCGWWLHSWPHSTLCLMEKTALRNKHL